MGKKKHKRHQTGSGSLAKVVKEDDVLIEDDVFPMEEFVETQSCLDEPPGDQNPNPKGGIDHVQTRLKIDISQHATVGLWMKIEDEIMLVKAIDHETRTLKVQRGVRDTEPRFHANRTRVYVWGRDFNMNGSYERRQRVKEFEATLARLEKQIEESQTQNEGIRREIA